MAALRGTIKKLLTKVVTLAGLTYETTPILMYHSVHPSHPLAVRPAAFREQIAFFTGHFKVVSLSEYLRAKRENRLAPGTGAVTFDDGYQDNYRYAYPILAEHSCPATIFITTGFLEADNHQDLSRRANLYPDLPPLTWRELEAMQPLVEVGAHTHSHIQIAGVEEGVLGKELAVNIETIADNLGVKPSIIAYPWGQPFDFHRPGCRLVKQFFRGAVTTIFGADNSSAQICPYHLRRVGVGPRDDLDFFAAKTAGALDFFRTIKRVQGLLASRADRNTVSRLGRHG